MTHLDRTAFWAGNMPGVGGALLLAQLAAARLLLSATTTDVFVAGRELRWGCFFKKLTGFPCPTCGLTRSILLTLQGDLGAALGLNPAGALLVLGALLLALALLGLAVGRRHLDRLAAGRLHGRIRVGAGAYGALLLAVLLVHWLAEIVAR